MSTQKRQPSLDALQKRLCSQFCGTASACFFLKFCSSSPASPHIRTARNCIVLASQIQRKCLNHRSICFLHDNTRPITKSSPARSCSSSLVNAHPPTIRPRLCTLRLSSALVHEKRPVIQDLHQLRRPDSEAGKRFCLQAPLLLVITLSE